MDGATTVLEEQGKEGRREQRQFQRKLLKTRAVIALEGGGAVVGRTVDISTNGLCVNLADPLRIGVPVQLRFDLLVDGKPHTIQVHGRVTYCILSGSEFKTGVQFMNVELAVMTSLAKFLR